LEVHGLSVAERAVLEVLVVGGPATVPSVARDLDVARQVVQRAADQLVQGGWTERRPNPAHKRAPLWAATDKGQRVFQAVRLVENALLMQAGVTEEDVLAAERVLCSLRELFPARGTA
jgi:DNA-binding MarR family transcriptional regulator